MQKADIEVKFGSTNIKNIVLAVPDKKTANQINVKLDGIEQVIENNKQDGKNIAIQLKSACEIKAGSTIRISINLES